MAVETPAVSATSRWFSCPLVSRPYILDNRSYSCPIVAESISTDGHGLQPEAALPARPFATRPAFGVRIEVRRQMWSDAAVGSAG
jgi:hypothetical protein